MDDNTKKALAASIGAAARAGRRKLKLTQEDTAERLEVSAEFYARIERGHALPSVPTLAKLKDALGVGADILLNLQLPPAAKAAAAAARAAEPPPVLPDEDDREMRRLVRRLRRASPATLRLVGMFVQAVEGKPRHRGKGSPDSDDLDTDADTTPSAT